MLAVALAAAVAAKPPPRQFLRADAAHHLASVTLVAGYDSSNRGFNFDGYGRGELVVTVPLGWRVRVTCTNRSDVRHSCAVVKGAMSAQPAFRGASVPSPLVGLRHGQMASFSFVAARLGPYRLACLVPGHEEARMWDVLEVVRGGAPSIAARPGP
jgi:FtsP/CotA-like multicopper oxidase with cupredoxin domain